jgi:hypothetical protein
MLSNCSKETVVSLFAMLAACCAACTGQSNTAEAAALAQSPPGFDGAQAGPVPGQPIVRADLRPLDDFESRGPAGGPFLPANRTFALVDTGTTTIDWQASTGDAWLSVSPSSGTLAPSQAVRVTIEVDEAASTALRVGPQSSYVEFVDAASSTTLASRSVALSIEPASPEQGWTVFTPSADTRKVHVSSSTGNDTNNGLTPASPKRTIAAGKALIRDGYPDWLLLKCGDTWDETIGNWSASGRSAAEPALVASYGTGERPFLRSGTSDGIVPAFNTNPNFVSVVGLHFKAHLYTGSNGSPKGVNWIRHTTGFLLEDCLVERYSANVVIQGYNETNGNQMPNRHANVRIRRNVLVEAYNTNSGSGLGSSGLFVANCDGVVIEENVFDHNGWVEGLAGSLPTWHQHNGYVCNGNTGVVLRDNIVYGTDGVMMRCGGVVESNLYLKNYNAILFGLGIEPEPAGVSGSIRGNVVLDGRDYGNGAGAPMPGGLCLDMGNVVNTTVSGNIFAHNSTGTAPKPMQIHDAHQYNSFRVAENTTISDNIVFDWGGVAFDIRTAEGGQNQQPVNLHLTGNIFQNSRDAAPLVQHGVAASLASVTSAHNKFHSQAPDSAWFRVGNGNLGLTQWKVQVHDHSSNARRAEFPDPNRTIATYQASVGGAQTVEAFMAEARQQSKANWRAQYSAAAVIAYIRAGFGR